MMKKEKPPKINKQGDRLTKEFCLILLDKGLSVYSRARGMSMYPFIKNGDRIKTEPIKEKEEIKVGDIIAVNMKDKVGPWSFAHRVVKIAGCEGKKIYFTKGDFCKKGLDEPVPIELIAGKITRIQRRGLGINLKLPRWRRLNSIIAKLSLRYPKILHFLSKYISLIIEWKLLLFKVKNRLKKVSPVLCDTEELLLICARKNLNNGMKKRAQELIKEGINWQLLFDSARKSGVTLFIYNALRVVAPYVRIPESVLERLRPGCLYIVSTTISQHKELVDILELFAEKGIPAVPLKGTLLSKRLYNDIAARGLSIDLDFLIEEKNKERARILLEEAGYSFMSDNLVKRWQWQYDFFKSKAVMIDLHWDITMMNRSDERIAGFWRGTRLAEEDGVSYREFNEVELLLHLSVHLVNSSVFRKLVYICDVNELLDKYKDTLDWDDLTEKARRWRMPNSLYLTLTVSKTLFDSPVPDQVLRKLRPNFLKLMFMKIFVNKNVILRNGLRKRFIKVFLSYIFFELIEARSVKEYLAIFKKVFFPPEEIMRKKSYAGRALKGAVKLLRKLC